MLHHHPPAQDGQGNDLYLFPSSLSVTGYDQAPVAGGSSGKTLSRKDQIVAEMFKLYNVHKEERLSKETPGNSNLAL